MTATQTTRAAKVSKLLMGLFQRTYPDAKIFWPMMAATGDHVFEAMPTVGYHYYAPVEVTLGDRTASARVMVAFDAVHVDLDYKIALENLAACFRHINTELGLAPNTGIPDTSTQELGNG